MSSLFRKARQNRVFQDVVDQIQNAILDGRLKAGEKLPPERDLGEMLETSRGTLREALRVLEQKGLIEIKLGVNGGAIVKQAGVEPMSESLAMLIQSQAVSLAHLSEFRAGVESTATALAAERATPKDVRHLKTLLEKALALTQKGTTFWNDFIKVDEQIHSYLALMSGNPLYRYIMETVHDNIQRYYDMYLCIGDQEMEENYQDLAQIIQAVAEKQVNLAGRLAGEHVTKFNHYMNKRLKSR